MLDAAFGSTRCAPAAGGAYRSAESQMAPSSLLPNFLPSLRSSSGNVKPARLQRQLVPYEIQAWHAAAAPMAPSRCCTRRMRSVPAVMLPHWSLPPICAAGEDEEQGQPRDATHASCKRIAAPGPTRRAP